MDTWSLCHPLTFGDYILRMVAPGCFDHQNGLLVQCLCLYELEGDRPPRSAQDPIDIFYVCFLK